MQAVPQPAGSANSLIVSVVKMDTEVLTVKRLVHTTADTVTDTVVSATSVKMGTWADIVTRQTQPTVCVTARTLQENTDAASIHQFL